MNYIAQTSVTVLLTLFLSFKIVLPVFRKRPVIFSTQSLVIISLMFLVLNLLLHNSILLILSSLAFITIALMRLWFIVGITKKDLETAAVRAMQGTMSQAEFDTQQSFIRFTKPEGTIKIYDLILIKILRYNLSKTPKTILFTTVFQKMIDNYFFHI